MKTDGSVTCPQEPATGPHPELLEPSLRPTWMRPCIPQDRFFSSVRKNACKSRELMKFDTGEFY
jgi:hypothetical protein